jgi:hypothetical protein
MVLFRNRTFHISGEFVAKELEANRASLKLESSAVITLTKSKSGSIPSWVNDIFPSNQGNNNPEESNRHIDETQ